MYLGIDLGTSAVKTVLVDATEHVHATGSATLDVQRPAPHWSEQDPEAWWRATIAAVLALPKSLRAQVQGIGLSGQMHGAVFLDAEDRPLRPAILWNDGRSAAECDLLEEREPRSREITGNLAMPGFTAPKVLWVQRHEPEVFRKTRSVLLPKDYLRLKLTGEKISDCSDASGTLWLDVSQRCWSEAMLAASGLESRHMPALVEGSDIAGVLTLSVAEELGLGQVPLAGGAGDNAASAVGCGVIAPGQAFLSLGTSGVLFAVTDRFRPNPEEATHAFCHALPGRWHQMSVMLSAASVLDWVARIAGFNSVAAAAEAATQQGLQAATPFFLPYLGGERTPHNDSLAQGVFYGMTHDTMQADLVVAALEGVAYGLADGLDSLRNAGVMVNPPLTILGGAAQVDLWTTLIAAALDRPLVRRQASQFGAALGAARLARLALTREDPVALCTQPAIERLIEPDPALSARMRERRPTFSRLYRQLKPVFKGLAA